MQFVLLPSGCKGLREVVLLKEHFNEKRPSPLCRDELSTGSVKHWLLLGFTALIQWDHD